MSWKSAELGTLLDKLMDFRGRTPKKLGMDWGGDIPALSAVNVRDGVIDLQRTDNFGSETLYEKWMTKGDVQCGDVVITTEAPLGNVAQIPDHQKYILSQRVILLRPDPTILDATFLALQMTSPEFQMLLVQNESGSTVTGIRQSRLVKLPVLFPNLTEQQRIVKEIREQNAHLTSAEEHLEHVPNLLERFRQSVLASAFRGDLTAEWREQNPDVEPASELLKRIRVERKRLWIEDYARKLADRARASAQKKNKAFTDEDWQSYYDKKLKAGESKYEEPEPVDAEAEGLPELPPTWEWVRLPMCGELSRGKSTHRPRNDPAIFGNQYPFIQTGEVANSHGYITDASTYYNERGLEQSRLFPIGTVCITIAANIADSAVLAIPCCFPDSVVGLISIEGMVVPEYVEFFIRTARANLSQYSARATAQKNINLSILNDVFIPLAPYREAQELVARLKQQMESVERLTQIHGEVYRELGRLRRSVLASAFSNERDLPKEAFIPQRIELNTDGLNDLIEHIDDAPTDALVELMRDDH